MFLISQVVKSLVSPSELSDRLSKWTSSHWNQAQLDLKEFQAIMQSSAFPEDMVVVSWLRKLMVELLVILWAFCVHSGHAANYLEGK